MLGRVRWRFRTSRSVIEFDNCTRWRTPKEYETQSNIIILRRLLLQVYKLYLRTLLCHSLSLTHTHTLSRAHRVYSPRSKTPTSSTLQSPQNRLANTLLRWRRCWNAYRRYEYLHRYNNNNIRNVCGQRGKMIVIVKITRTMRNVIIILLLLMRPLKIVTNHATTTPATAMAEW